MSRSKSVVDEKSGLPVPFSALTRRDFLKRMGLMGGGLVVYAAIGDLEALARAPRRGFAGANVPTDFNAFVHIGADNRVTGFVGKIEMGQGPITSFVQMLAEELDVTYEQVDLIMGDTALCPWDAGTWGSLSTRHYGVFVKEAACEAKGVLKQLAAEKLSLPEARLKTADGAVFDQQKPARRVTYGQLTAGKIIERHLKTLPPLKPYVDYTISGKPHLRRDARAKVTGQAKYAADMRLPHMLYARILRPPAHGAKLLKVDITAAEKMRDVQVVRDGDLIAVLHPRPDGAAAALAAVKAHFDLPKTGIDDKTIYDHLLKHAPPAEIAGEAGDLAAGQKASAHIIEETYLNAYVAHAPMEPHAALAAVEIDQATVWASTQSPFGVQRQVARAVDLPVEKVRIITPFVGGGFGGKAASSQAIEAAHLAKWVGRPVMVNWTREEEFFHDTFRPAAVVKIKSGLDAAGRMCLWDYKVYFAGQRGCENFYTIPNHREAVYGEWHLEPGIHPFAVGAWRAPGANTNTYARDLHLHIMASRAGADPLAFRLKHLEDKRMRRVLAAAAEKFGYQALKTPSGRGYGISCGIDAETYVAALAEVEVDRDSGAIVVKRVVCAQDMGQVVNPQGATLQMEGCITMGLGYALSEEIHFSDGRLSDLNFDTYAIPRFSWVPRIETMIVPNAALPPKGGGEPAIVCMGGVLASAVFDATGAIVRQLPMTPARVKAALKKVA
jgi:nicotinate dehydrogenase subunit B